MAIRAKNRKNYCIGYKHLGLLSTLKVYDPFKYVHQVISKHHLFFFFTMSLHIFRSISDFTYKEIKESTQINMKKHYFGKPSLQIKKNKTKQIFAFYLEDTVSKFKIDVNFRY